MFDSYKHFLETPEYNKIIGEDYLIVEFKCPIKEEIFNAWSECHSIVYVLSGQKKWIIKSDEYLVKENQSVFVRKGGFKNQQYFESDFCVLMFFMKDDFIKRCVQEDISAEVDTMTKLDHPDVVYRINITESLETLYHSFFSYLKQEKKVSQKIIELKFREMLLNICAEGKNPDIKNLLYTISQDDQDPIKDIMEEQFIYNLKVDEFARLCGKSTSSFKRDFKKVYNSTPGKWLLNKRLDMAKYKLLNSDLSIQEVCYDCGFESDSHFIRSFKSEFGKTPKLWRESKRLVEQ